NSSVNRRPCSRRSMMPWNTRSARTIGTTDQKILARNVEKPIQRDRRLSRGPAAAGTGLEGVLDSDGPDDIRTKALVAVEGDLGVAASEERSERIPLEPEGEVGNVAAIAAAVWFPVPEEVGDDGQARVDPALGPDHVPQIVVFARTGRHLVPRV